MVLVAELKFREGTESRAEELLRAHVAHVDAQETSTLEYALQRSRKDGSFLVFERYADQAAYDAHAKSPAMQRLFGALQPLLDGPPVIRSYDELVAVRR